MLPSNMNQTIKNQCARLIGWMTGGREPGSPRGPRSGACALLGLVGGLLMGGCAGTDVLDPVHRGPFFVPKNQTGESSMGNVRRVLLLPVCGGSVASPEVAAGLDAVFATALQGENRFEVITLSREDCQRRFQAAEFCSAGALPHGFLGRLRQEFAADAVLLVDLTVFDAYRPIVVGLRAKLAAIDGSRLIWSFDNVFAADDPAVANSARRHYLTGDRGGLPLDLTPGVLQSPGRFAGFAAAMMFATLPPVVPPQAVAAAAARK